jgi:pimeloyl-ACP methyl ester carboxylesterase
MKAFTPRSLAAQMRYHQLPGMGIPLVFLHGLGGASSCDFPRLASDAALRARHTILIDLLGSGYSDKPENFHYTLEDHADMVIALLDDLAIEQCYLFGHQMGATLAITIAARRRYLVQRVIISDPLLDEGGDELCQTIRAWSEAEYLEQGHQQLITRLQQQNQLLLASTMSVASPLAIHRQACDLVRGAWRESLYHLTMPRWVLFGEYTLPTPEIARLPQHGVQTATVPQAGHDMLWETPGAVAMAINNAINSR